MPSLAQPSERCCSPSYRRCLCLRSSQRKPIAKTKTPVNGTMKNQGELILERRSQLIPELPGGALYTAIRAKPKPLQNVARTSVARPAMKHLRWFVGGPEGLGIF